MGALSQTPAMRVAKLMHHHAHIVCHRNEADELAVFIPTSIYYLQVDAISPSSLCLRRMNQKNVCITSIRWMKDCPSIPNYPKATTYNTDLLENNLWYRLTCSSHHTEAAQNQCLHLRMILESIGAQSFLYLVGRHYFFILKEEIEEVCD